MTAMELLARCRRRGETLEKIRAQAGELDDMLTSVSRGLGLGVQSGQEDQYAICMARKDELERKISREGRLKAAEDVAVIMLSERLPEKERKTLRLYYCRGRDVPDIAQELHYSESTIYKALASGREKMRRVPKSRVTGSLNNWYIVEAGQDEDGA